MPLHLVKLAAGAKEVADIARFQARLRAAEGRIFHRTRQTPKRAAELLAGGSLFWVVAGAIQVRQTILDLEPATRHDGIDACDIVLDPTLTTVRPRAMRAFQGWRYLPDKDAPQDQTSHTDGAADLPPALRETLIKLALL